MFPSKYFQELCRCHSTYGFQAFCTFTDAFQGCFKDGMNGNRDCRYSAAVNLMTRIFLYATYTLAYEGTDFALLIVLLLIIFACLVRPYSQKFALYNYVDTVVISALAVFYGSTNPRGGTNIPREFGMGVPNSRGCQIPYDTGLLPLQWAVQRSRMRSRETEREMAWERG